MATVRYDFNDDLEDDIKKATARALLRVGGDCIVDTQEDVPVQSGNYRRSIRLDPPQEDNQGIFVVWGSFDVNYAIAVETGDISLIEGNAPQSRDIIEVANPRNTGHHWSMRRATERNYPKTLKYLKDEAKDVA